MSYDSDVTICSDDFDFEDSTSVHVSHNIDDETKNIGSNAPNKDKYIDTKYIEVNTNQNGITHDEQVIHNNNKDYNDNSRYVDVNMNQNGVTRDDRVIHVIEERIAIDIEPQKTNSSVVNCDKSNKGIDFVGILQELKELRSELDKPIPCRNLDNAQTQNDIDDDSDATYCETLPNTQTMLNKTLEETQIYSISDFTPFYTHYSESQMQNVAVDPKLIYKNQKAESKKQVQILQNTECLNDGDFNEYNTDLDNVTGLGTNMTFSQNAQNSESSIHVNQYNASEDNILKPEPNNISKIDTFATHLNSYVHNSTLEKHSNSFDNVANYYTLDTNMNDGNINDNITIIKHNNKISSIFENKNDAIITNDKATNDAMTNGNSQIVANDIDIDSNESDDMTDSQREIVPFKVIEELNKIKAYLKKRNDRRTSVDGSSDSGYRSDSQGRSSRTSTYSSTSINQSAHSLLTYIICCSLTTNTYEITREVSRTLGSLIDKLHEDETYPPFLEILLETITELLRSIYEDECSNVLLTKDEKIQRVLLLNKSAHIQKYTIDKITNILESIDAEANEINHTAKMENLCYIFHILEIILSKYKVENNSQSQDSQEKVLKRSSITDIWRKKWNLTKEIIIDNVEKKYDLTKCSEVLNKMIVNCMEGYSLISFVALKCFNLLQP
ncbi:uncharacterized protein LOC115452601 [Manduca sexta]|uniref:uncharacterized protein LOC115452601 n=1 Tax=Manduca sexta TaxID=7130 RepID=UPI0018901F26|nr:uncharacterized protein LOC115452601 [Manduca sexta]